MFLNGRWVDTNGSSYLFTCDVIILNNQFKYTFSNVRFVFWNVFDNIVFGVNCNFIIQKIRMTGYVYQEVSSVVIGFYNGLS